MQVPIGVSVRHIHLCSKHLAILFGEEYQLEHYRNLTQPYAFASQAQVTIRTEKHQFERVRVVGPLRSKTQIEISRSDAFLLGLKPPVRESGDLKDSPGITIIGPCGQITVEEGVIIASRHIHMSEEEALRLGIRNIEGVKVKIKGRKGGILDNVYLKIGPNYILELHLDTDDANAHMVDTGDIAYIMGIDKN